MPTDEELRQKASKIGRQDRIPDTLRCLPGRERLLGHDLFSHSPPKREPAIPLVHLPHVRLGIGILVHYFGAYRGLGYEEKLASREYQRVKEQQNK